MLMRQAFLGARAWARAARVPSARVPVRTAVAFVEPDETPFAALLADRALMSRVSEPVRQRWLQEHERWTEYQAKVDEFVKAAMGSMGLSEGDGDKAAELLESQADGADGAGGGGGATGLGLDPAIVSILDGVPDEALNYLSRQRTRHYREVCALCPSPRARSPVPHRASRRPPRPCRRCDRPTHLRTGTRRCLSRWVAPPSLPPGARCRPQARSHRCSGRRAAQEKRDYHVKSQELRMNHTYDRGLRRRKAAFVKRLVNDTLRNAI